ncbi:MAG: PEP-CTERM sorting domain-containing protein [Proteobacteria bacterium]|nr:MAG: PEP-CTERM sorting domain-containing protein [Pseudomonadota bacterium]
MKPLIHLLMLGAGALATSSAAQAVELLVPAYFYPGTHTAEWQQLTDTAARQPLSVIINPDNGVGDAVDASHTSAINALRAAGGKVYAYVGTDWAARSFAEVTQEIDRYLDWYAVDGFFVDEVSEYAKDLGYFTALGHHVRTANPALGLIGNPGTPTDISYLDIFDTLVIFEEFAHNLDQFAAPPYQHQFDAARFGLLLHGADTGTMATVIGGAAAANVGYAFVTDGVHNHNLWQTLPSYWDAETLAARQAILTPVPEPAPAAMLLGGLAVLSAWRYRKRP